MTPLQGKKVAILGAGISGLTCGYYLKKKYGNEIDLTILEKSDRAGGWIRSQTIQGHFFEAGPRAFRLSDAHAALTLIEELGLSDQIIHAQAKTRFLYHNGKLQPVNLRSLLSWALVKDLFLPRSIEEETVYQFFSRRFSTAFADQFIDPLVKGIYAGNPKQLSMQACFPALLKHRSLILGLLQSGIPQSGLFTLKNGLETLIHALKDKLPIHYNTEIKDLDPYDHVISTLPAHALPSLVPELAPYLNQIPFRSIQVVHLAYAEPLPYPGYGYLVPAKEKQPILGVIFDSSVFPQQGNQTRLTVMLPEEVLHPLETAKKQIAKDLNLHNPLVESTHLAFKAIPQYPLGFKQILKKMKHPKIQFYGTSFHSVSVANCISKSMDVECQ